MDITNSTTISKVYKSRNILLAQLKERGFDVDDYEYFSINELRTMYIKSQLDMLLINPKNKKKIYVKYHFAKGLRPNHIFEYIEDLYQFEEILNENDELLIIIKDKINVKLQNIIANIFIKENIFCCIRNLKSLQYNILKHSLVPTHIILNDTQVEEIKKKYNITNMQQFPEISRFDPVAEAIGLRPGNVCEIIRPSKTAISSKYYRLCY